jgi:hypothetical protein
MRKTKPAERSIIARRLRHAESGWAQFPVPTTLSLIRDAATKLAR